ncbi:hypothetical protein VNI00_009504 [Paramarasmius palmivorus]|uniref:ENTH domain-containing protein n=1 Tax=Paramarasmius palmivorus TaxID=297713 RepID=A0AAW0CQC1_9AGAR
MQHFGKAALRATKNYTKGYSDTQAKVRDATSNDPWGPTGQQMNEIAKLSWNQQDFIEIIEILDKRLNDKGKNWRHVFKTLAVIDYCLLQGSEDVVRYYKENMYMIKTLREFQYVDEDGTDQGANVRQRAKDITNLLLDDSKIRQQRRSRADARDRMRGNGGESATFDSSTRRSRRNNKEDEDLQRAIEESMKSSKQGEMTQEEKDLLRAIKLSEEEEANRSKNTEDSSKDASTSATEAALFDDSNQLPPPNAQLQFNNNPFPMDGGLQPQFTQFQPQFGQMQMQPQFTSFNPYQQQMQEAAQAEYLRQQELFQQQQAQQQQEEWMRQQMMQQQQQFQQQQQQQSLFPQQTNALFPQQNALVPQPTGFGANNPFARMSGSPTPGGQNNQNNNNQLSFNIQGTYESGKHLQTHDLSSTSGFRSPSPGSSAMQSPSSPSQQGNRPIQVRTKQNENQELANLFADRDGGQDTFGNVGMLRYGHTDAGRVLATQTTPGKNPFAMQQQQQQQNSDQPFFSL